MPKSSTASGVVALLLTLCAGVALTGCNPDANTSAKRVNASPQEQFDRIMDDLEKGLAGSTFRQGTATLSLRPTIKGEILEPETDSEPPRAVVTVFHRFSFADSRMVAEKQETTSTGLSDPAMIGEGGPTGFDPPTPAGGDTESESGDSEGGVRDVRVHRDDEFEETIRLVHRDGAWVCDGDVELESLQLTIDHALRAQ